MIAASEGIHDASGAAIVTQLAKEVEKELAKINVQYDPNFRAQFEIPMAERVSAAKTVMQSYGVDPKEADAIRVLSGKDRLLKIRELTKDLGDMGAMAAAEISLPFRIIDEIATRREAALKDAERLQGQLQATRVEQTRQFRHKTISTAIGLLAEEGHFPLVEITPGGDVTPEAAQKWNKFSSKIKQDMANVAASEDPMQQAKAMAAGHLAEYYLRVIEAQKAQVAEMQATIQKMSSAAPTGGTPPSGTPPAAPAKKGPLTAEAFWEKTHRASQAALGAKT
jgi:hypothetical protein